MHPFARRYSPITSAAKLDEVRQLAVTRTSNNNRPPLSRQAKMDADMPVQESAQLPVSHRDFGRVSVYFGERSGKYPDGNQVLIRGSEVRTALDTPLVSNHIGPAFDDSEMVVLGHVHEDHIAGLHRLPNAPVYAHVLDLPTVQSWDGMLAAYGDMDPSQAAAMRANFERKFHYTPRPDAIGYEDGALWDLGSNRITAFHLPGHTAGHCALLIEPEEVLFIGDIDLTGFGPYYGDACSNLADFRRSLDAVARIPAKVWVTSHHRGIYTDREQFLHDLAIYTAKLTERESKLLTMLRSGPRTLSQLVEQRLLYPPGYDAAWVKGAERRTIGQHLAELLADGRLVQHEDRYQLA